MDIMAWQNLSVTIGEYMYIHVRGILNSLIRVFREQLLYSLMRMRIQCKAHANELMPVSGLHYYCNIYTLLPTHTTQSLMKIIIQTLYIHHCEYLVYCMNANFSGVHIRICNYVM